MFHGTPNSSTCTLKCSTEPLNVPRRLSNVPCIPKMFHGDAEILHRAPKYSMETVNCSTELLNIPRNP